MTTRHPQAAPELVNSLEDGVFSVVTLVGSTTTHAVQWDGEEMTTLACTGKRPADAGYTLGQGRTANDVACQRCKALVPAAPVRRPQINHRRCSHPATARARRACREAWAARGVAVGGDAQVLLADGVQWHTASVLHLADTFAEVSVEGTWFSVLPQNIRSARTVRLG